MMKMVQILALDLFKGKNNLSYVEQTNLGNWPTSLKLVGLILFNFN